MSEPDAVPLPRAGEVFFDVRGEARTMRLSWYADSAVAVFSIWQGNRCTGTFRLPFADLDRMIATLQIGPPGQAAVGRRTEMPGYLAESGAYGAGEYGAGEYGAAGYADFGYGSSGYPGQWPGEVGADGYGPADYPPGGYGAAGYERADYGTTEYAGADFDGTGYDGGDYLPADEYADTDYVASEYGPGEYGPGEYGPGEYGPGEYGPGEYGPGEYGPGEYGPGEYGPGEYPDYASGADPVAEHPFDEAGYQSSAEYWAGSYGQSGPVDQPGLAGRYGDVEPIGRLDGGRAGSGRHRSADLPGVPGTEPVGTEPGWGERNGDPADLPAVSAQRLSPPAVEVRADAEGPAGEADLTGLRSVSAGHTPARR
jgi:hypothetical protein